MTTVLAIAGAEETWIGADSQGGNSWGWAEGRADPKVAVLSSADGLKVGIGFSGSYRVGQLLTVGWTVPLKGGSDDLWRWAVRDAIPSVRALLAAGGAEKVVHNEASHEPWVLAVPGRVFEIGSDYQVGELRGGIAAVGSGAQVAKAAVLGARRLVKAGPDDVQPRREVQIGLEVAAGLDVWTGPPFSILRVA